MNELDYLNPNLAKRKNPMYPGYDQEPPRPTESIIGDPSGRFAGWARTESGDRSWKIYEPISEPKKSDMTPETKSPWAKRGEFEDSLYEKQGLPRKRPIISGWDISKKVNALTTENEKGLFEHVFGNQARYEDRQHLDPKAQKAWKSALLQMRKNAELQVKSEMEGQQQEYDYAKGLIDEELKAYDFYERVFKPAKPKEEKPKDYSAKVSKATSLLAKIIKEQRLPNDNERISLEETLKNTPYKFKEDITKEIKRKGLIGNESSNIPVLSWINDMLWPDIKNEYADLSIVSRDQTSMLTPQTAQQGLDNNTIADILRQNGYAVTPENIANFKANNPG